MHSNRSIIAAIVSAVALTACGRLDQKTATQLITESQDYRTTDIERTILWTGNVPADNVTSLIGEKAINLKVLSCAPADPTHYTCEFSPEFAGQAKNWEPRDRGGYTDYRIPLYEQKLESVKVTKGSDPAEAIYRFHREPTPWGRKFGRRDVGESREFKAVFKKYDGAWQIDHLTPAG